ncbi:hypothetical protein 035JT004_63 [Bacillus phage 035JT004]|nr:hypothetical protein 035JT004_63 [Bacillus phage 035JT004]
MDFSKIKDGDTINYIGDSMAYGGTYTVLKTEATYIDPDKCPEEDRGKLLIIEFMNNGDPMFIPLGHLQSNEWELVEGGKNNE